MEASRKLPSKEVILQTLDNDYFLFKTDILAGLVTYSTAKNMAANLETITAERAKEIIEMNKQGEKPVSLIDDGKQKPAKAHIDLLEGGDISRFDKSKRKKKKNKPQQQNAKANNSSPKKENGGRRPARNNPHEHKSEE